MARPIAIETKTNRLAPSMATYDAAGNQTSQNGGAPRTYDAFKSMTANSNGMQYLYDANDEGSASRTRIERTGGGRSAMAARGW